MRPAATLKSLDRPDKPALLSSLIETELYDCQHCLFCRSFRLPIGSLVVPFWDYLIGF